MRKIVLPAVIACALVSAIGLGAIYGVRAIEDNCPAWRWKGPEASE